MVWEPLTKPRRGRAGGGDITITGLPFDFVPNVVYSTSEVYVSAKVRHKAGEGKFLKMLRTECCELCVEF